MTSEAIIYMKNITMHHMSKKKALLNSKKKKTRERQPQHTENLSINYLFSRNVFALETFFPMAEAFQEKYEPEGSTYSENKLAS